MTASSRTPILLVLLSFAANQVISAETPNVLSFVYGLEKTEPGIPGTSATAPPILLDGDALLTAIGTQQAGSDGQGAATTFRYQTFDVNYTLSSTVSNTAVIPLSTRTVGEGTLVAAASSWHWQVVITATPTLPGPTATSSVNAIGSNSSATFIPHQTIDTSCKLLDSKGNVECVGLNVVSLLTESATTRFIYSTYTDSGLGRYRMVQVTGSQIPRNGTPQAAWGSGGQGLLMTLALGLGGIVSGFLLVL